VGTVSFKYLKFRIKLWNHFQGEINTNDDSLIVRASVYDPRFFMPSLTTIKLKINIPPIGCRLKLNKYTGIEYLTEYILKVSGCNDEHMPLSYQYSYFSSYDQYMEDIYNASSLN